MEFWGRILAKLNKKTIILGVLGILLILLGNWQGFFTPAKNNPPAKRSESRELGVMGSEKEEKSLEKELEDILGQIEGVGEVKVRLVLASGKQYRYAYNQNVEKRITEEKDQQGGSRVTTESKDGQEMLVVRDSQSGTEKPVILQEVRAPINGVIVVAQGAKDSAVKASLWEAVQTVLEIPAYQVIVLPKERRGEEND